MRRRPAWRSEEFVHANHGRFFSGRSLLASDSGFTSTDSVLNRLQASSYSSTPSVATLLQFDALERAALPARPLHLAIGMFDGVHLGHKSVIDSAIHSARRSGGLAGVLTFWPHPSVLFRPENPTRLMMSPAMKRRVLGGLGIDFLVEQNFSHEFAGIGAGEFVAFLRKCLPQLAAVYVGENWRFGRDRAGDVHTLVAEGRKVGLEVYSAPRLNHNGAPISSSRIRGLLEAGSLAEA